MAQFKFKCPHCQQHLEAETDWIGQVAACPSCGKKIKIQMQQIQLKKVEIEQGQLFQCQTCGKKISVQAQTCPNCGAPNPEFVPPKSSLVYIILLLFFGYIGLHDIYIGRTMRGSIKIAIGSLIIIIPTLMSELFSLDSLAFITAILLGGILAGWVFTDILFMPNVDADNRPLK